MKNSVKGIDKTGHGFEYLRNKFPNVSDAKIKEGIFIGPQIRELMQDKQFDEDLNETERNAWLSFKGRFTHIAFCSHDVPVPFPCHAVPLRV